MESIGLLENIQSPQDLKQLSVDSLPRLAEEIRKKIITVLSKTGGHLSSNLGVVELCLALHYVFDSPKDNFVFDVGHQCYTHKLVTGRNDPRFSNIRKSEGLSGFSCPAESDHDLFYSGHAGNALSLALGIAETEKKLEAPHHTVCFIGDASLTCGLLLEALNNIPEDLGNFIIVLNDNKMSISENTGSITRILSHLLNHPTAGKLRHRIGRWLRKIPGCGQDLEKGGRQASISIKNLFCSAPFFEQFGLSYIGPVDGHNVEKLVTLFEKIKYQPFPIIVHTVTVKGQGLRDAQEDPASYHGVSPNFKKVSCGEESVSPSQGALIPSTSPKEKTFPQIFGETLCNIKEYSDISVITPAMSLGSCLENFKKKYPQDFYDVGIAEGHAVTFSGGLAKKKAHKVFCSIYSTFLLRALDNLFHDVCMQGIPVVFAIDRAGLAFEDGRSHHGIYDLTFLRTMPEMIIAQPRNGDVLKDLLHSSLSWTKPSAIRYPKITTECSHRSFITRNPGIAEILHQGEDLLIIALGHTYKLALDLRSKLLEQGISPTIVDPVFIKPLDINLLSTLLMTHSRVVTIEEHSLKGGLGSEINDFLLSFDFGKTQVLNFGIPDTFFDHGNPQKVYQSMALDVQNMYHKIMTSFGFRIRRCSPYLKYQITSK